MTPAPARRKKMYEIHFERKPVNNHILNIYNPGPVVMGFTELDAGLEDIAELFPGRQLVELEQIHSNLNIFSTSVVQGKETRGDGIILDSVEHVAIIKTADCTPLFFWNTNGSIGGVVHIGWKGLHQSIELKLLERLTAAGCDISHLNFFLGPAIEQSCYEVGVDLYEIFSGKSYREEIFAPHPSKPKKYMMDVKRGIRLSLIKVGFSNHSISETKLCTFCQDQRFPSYRRSPDLDGRIYSFLALNPCPCLQKKKNQPAQDYWQ